MPAPEMMPRRRVGKEWSLNERACVILWQRFDPQDPEANLDTARDHDDEQQPGKTAPITLSQVEEHAEAEKENQIAHAAKQENPGVALDASNR